MNTKIPMDDFEVINSADTFIIQKDKEFPSFGNLIPNNYTFKVKSIINYFSKVEYHEKDIPNLLRDKKIADKAAIIITDPKIDHDIKTMNYVTAVVWADISHVYGAGEKSSDEQNRGSINIILLINKNLSPDLLIRAYSWAVEAKVAALWDLDIRSDNYDLATGNECDSLIVACAGESDEPMDKKELRTLIGKCIREATKQSILNNGYSKSVLDYIHDAGIKIEDLVEAGMELCVGVEKSQELYKKLHKQIIISLEDLNVVSFIIAGIRLEEDYKKHRVEGINVDDDPAYLYSDEVLGMSVANQIAGTKAIFNFKRYDEEKPGIIGELGPILDDIFAGLVAGCMSKIFEVDGK